MGKETRGGKRKGAGRKPLLTQRFGISANESTIKKYGLKELRRLIHEFIKTL